MNDGVDINTTQSDDWAVPKWEREQPRSFWDPSRKLLKSIRAYQNVSHKSSPIACLNKKLCVLRYRFWSIVTGADIPLSCQIGGGLLMPHPTGIVIHPEANIGINCLLMQQVTIAGKVTLGLHVDVGAGAKILGPLVLGDHSRVGANAVVTKDVTPHQTVVGIPAKPL